MGLLDGKRCIVSGVGPGLGQALVRAMVREGAAVAMAARTADYLETLAAELGACAVPVPTDITDAVQCRALVEEAVRRLGGLDVLVNSAFVPDVFQPFETVDLDEWRGIFDVNVWGTLQLTQAAVPVLKEGGGGSIVFVNSMAIRKPMARQVAYAASKGALFAAARGLAVELGRYGIRVNSLVPGWMLGPPVEMYLEYQAEKRGVRRDDVLADLGSRTALGAIPTQEDCAEAAVFLASDLSRAMTGQTIDVNGGEVFN
jgi:NAD(P)-dependent dehydrogenase (short-subunit alcohol dehydrogenase family)